MDSKVIRSIYFITLILFCGIVSAIAFAGLDIIPQTKGIIEEFGYHHYFYDYIAIYLPIAAISLWLKPLKLLRHFIYAGFFILLVCNHDAFTGIDPKKITLMVITFYLFIILKDIGH